MESNVIVWEVFENENKNVIYLVEIANLAEAVKTALEIKKEGFKLKGMYTDKELKEAGILWNQNQGKEVHQSFNLFNSRDNTRSRSVF